MGDSDEILDQLLLWGERFRIHDHELAVMCLTQMDQQRIAKASQTILMRQYYLLYLSGENRVYQFQELLTLEIHPAANFRDPLIDFNVLLLTILLKYSFLIL